MPLTTVAKLRFLYDYLAVNAEKLSSYDKTNITAIKIDKKRVKGSESNRYAIVFQVSKKLPEAALSSDNIIPNKLSITFPDGIKRTLKTDVQQTGRFRFQSFIGGPIICPKYGYGSGSMGLFVSDGLATYALTNYHVVAGKLLESGQTDYQRNPGDYNANVAISSLFNAGKINGVLDCGTFSHKADVAFVLVNNSGLTQNKLYDGSFIKGFWKKAKVVSALRGKQITIYSRFNRHGVNAIVANVAAEISDNNDYSAAFSELIQLDRRVTQDGDSGGVAIDSVLKAVVGIVVGADDSFTYLVPFYNIYNFKHSNPL